VDRIEQAVILAAGEGQRLRPFTASKPKVMIPIANKPILRYVVEAVARNGIRKIVIVMGYRKDQVMDYLGSGDQFDVEIEYVEQPAQLGAAHALKQVQGVVSGRFLAVSGDNIIEPDTVSPIIQAEPNTVLVKEQEHVSKYGVVESEHGVVTGITEKPAESLSHVVNTGIYVFDDGIFDAIGQEVDLINVISAMIGTDTPLRACETEGAWLDVVYPWDMLKLNGLALAKVSPASGGTMESGVSLKGLVSVGKGTTIRANSYIVGPAIIGEDCEIGPSVCILPSTSIGDNVCISPFTTISNSVIADGVEIGPSSVIEDSIIDRGCLARGHLVSQSGSAEIRVDDEYLTVQVGAMIGERCEIGHSVVVAPGVIMGNRCHVRPLKVIEHSVPDGGLVV
jgi:glucose-1-phosphate thymidylyltransferase